jgi:hypothetical protein
MYAYLDSLNHLDPHTDDPCQNLADYLAGGLNYAIAQKITGEVAVRDTRSYDAVDVDLSALPLLKVFRQKESVDLSGVVSVDLVISYSMVMPDRAKLPGIMRWVARHITLMLIAIGNRDASCPFQLTPKDIEKIQTEYRIMVNDFNLPAYAYLRMTISAREFS